MNQFEPYLTRWQLKPDGEPLRTHSSHVLAVRDAKSRQAMLKIPTGSDERRGAAVIAWWSGNGAAEVYAYDSDSGAVLMERATGSRSLTAMAVNGEDDNATRTLCAAAQKLHEPRGSALPDLVPLNVCFSDLETAVSRYGGLIAAAAPTTRRLLADQRDVRLLHGDLHHDNVLDFAGRGWLAIDPKGLLGERTFDFANLLFNPEDTDLVAAPDRFARQVDLIAASAQLDKQRLLGWILAFGALSAVWRMNDGQGPLHDLTVAEMAAAALSS